MRVKLKNGELIDVKFRREELGHKIDGGGFKSVIRSHCRISRVISPSGKGRDNYVVLAESYATRHRNDPPSKAEGFRKALENVFNHYCIREPFESKGNRELIWKEFIKMYGSKL